MKELAHQTLNKLTHDLTAEKWSKLLEKWSNEKTDKPILLTGANRAVGNAQSLILNLIKKQDPPITPDEYGADQAAKKDHLDILKLLADLSPLTLPTKDGANREAW